MYRRRSGQRTKMSLSLWKRSFFTKRIVKDQLDNEEDEIKISNGIVIEHDGHRLQKRLRSRIKELFELQKEHSKGRKKWTKKYENLGGKCEAIYEVDEMIFRLLENVNSVNNDFIKQNDNFIEELRKLYKSIPKKEQFQSLKSQIAQEHKNVKQIKENCTKSTKDLTRQQTQINEELDEVKIAQRNRGLGKSERGELRRRKELLSTKHKNTIRQIEMANEDRDKAINSYTMKANILLKNSQQYQTNSLQSMKNILQNFINVLTMESPVFNQTKQKIKSSKNSIQSRKQYHSSSTDDDDGDDEKSWTSIDSDSD